MRYVVIVKVAFSQTSLRLFKFLEHYHVFLEDSVVFLLSREVIERATLRRREVSFQLDLSLFYFRCSQELRWSEVDALNFLDKFLVLGVYIHVTSLDIKVVIFLPVIPERFQITAYSIL